MGEGGTTRIRLAVLLGAFTLAAFLAAVSQVQAYVYWGDVDGLIGRADLDGSEAQRDFITGAGGACGVAVNDEHIYWANPLSHWIGRARTDGTTVRSQFIRVSNGPCGVALDGRHLFWSDVDGIGRANLDGSNVKRHLIKERNGSACREVAIDRNHLYWSNGDVARASHTGRHVNRRFVDTKGTACGLAVDASHVYWAEYFDNSIGRAQLDGSRPDSEYIGLDDRPCGVAVTRTHVYWGYEQRGIGRANLDGANVVDPLIADSYEVCGIAIDDPQPLTIAVESRNATRGTARLAARVDEPGMVELEGTRKVKPWSARIGAAGTAVLPLRARGSARRQLNHGGAVRVKATVTFDPDASFEPITATERVRLVKR